MPPKIELRKIQRIENLRLQGLSQHEVSEALNVSTWTVQKYSPIKPGRGKRNHLRRMRWLEYSW